MRALISSLVAGGLLAASTASAAPALTPPSRDASPVAAAEQAGSAWIWIGAAFVVLAVILLIADGDDEPDSP